MDQELYLKSGQAPHKDDFEPSTSGGAASPDSWQALINAQNETIAWITKELDAWNTWWFWGAAFLHAQGQSQNVAAKAAPLETPQLENKLKALDANLRALAGSLSSTVEAKVKEKPCSGHLLLNGL